MDKFSERTGYSTAREALQADDIDDRLRNGLWNAVLGSVPWMTWSPFARTLWDIHLGLPVDELDGLIERQVRDEVRQYFYQCEWFEVYDFLEFLAEHFPAMPGYPSERGNLVDSCNSVMQRECSAFRFVCGRIAQITDARELDCIDEAVSHGSPEDADVAHLGKALGFLSDRETPDYANSVKEAISAVEAVARQITSDPKATLGDALKLLRTQHDAHPALLTAFDKLYGYTSDAGGIRHAATDGRTVDFADAKFMLVACSAFVNYLRQKVPTGAGPSS